MFCASLALGGLKGGGGLAGTPLLLGCPSTFSTFIMSCEKNGKFFLMFCASLACRMILASCLELNSCQLVCEATGDLPLGHCWPLTEHCSDGLSSLSCKVPSFCQTIALHNAMQDSGSSFSILQVHADLCSSIQGALRFIQVDLGSTEVYAGPFWVHSGSVRVIHLWVNCHQSCPQKTYYIVHRRS